MHCVVARLCQRRWAHAGREGSGREGSKVHQKRGQEDYVWSERERLKERKEGRERERGREKGALNLSGCSDGGDGGSTPRAHWPASGAQPAAHQQQQQQQQQPLPATHTDLVCLLELVTRTICPSKGQVKQNESLGRAREKQRQTSCAFLRSPSFVCLTPLIPVSQTRLTDHYLLVL